MCSLDLKHRFERAITLAHMELDEMMASADAENVEAGRTDDLDDDLFTGDDFVHVAADHLDGAEDDLLEDDLYDDLDDIDDFGDDLFDDDLDDTDVTSGRGSETGAASDCCPLLHPGYCHRHHFLPLDLGTVARPLISTWHSAGG